MKGWIPVLAIAIGLGAGALLDVLVLDPARDIAPPVEPAPPDGTGPLDARVAWYGLPADDLVLREAASRDLGLPTGGPSPAVLAGFDAVALPPAEGFSHAEAVRQAEALVRAARSQRLPTVARPLVILRGWDPAAQPEPSTLSSQVILPVPVPAAVQPPLVAVRLPALRLAPLALAPIGDLPPSDLVARAVPLGAEGLATQPLLVFRFVGSGDFEGRDTRVQVYQALR